MSDLDGEIVAGLVSGLGGREVCHRLGSTMGRVRAALDERRAWMLPPARMRAEALATLDALERAWIARSGVTNVTPESRALLAKIHRQRARLLETA
jgi:hypothetical protein